MTSINQCNVCRECHAASVESILNIVGIDAKVGWGIVGINAMMAGELWV